MSYGGTRVLVTGADGFIGSHLADALVSAGAEVTALAQYNSFDRAGWLDDLPEDRRRAMRIVRGDIRDPGFIRGLVSEQQVVFHLAALIAIPFSYAAPQAYVETNVVGTLNVLEAARSTGIERLVHTSTSEVYGTARVTPITEEHPLQGQSPYAASKIGADMMVEAFVRSFELPAVTLRPFNTYGPRQSERAVLPTAIRQALDPACAAIELGDVSTQRDFNFVGDTVAAFLAVGTSAAVRMGEAYNAGSGRAVTIADAVDLLRSLSGTNKPVVSAVARRRPEASEVRVLLADSRRLTEATGWRPRTSLEDGLAATVAWWRRRVDAGELRRGAGYMV